MTLEEIKQFSDVKDGKVVKQTKDGKIIKDDPSPQFGGLSRVVNLSVVRLVG